MSTSGQLTPVWLNALAALVFFGGLAAGVYWFYQRREHGLAQVARRLALEYSEHGGARITLPGFLALPGGAWDLSYEVRRSFYGEASGAEIAIFELRCYQGGGMRDQQRLYGYPHVIAHAIVPELDLPRFYLAPEKWYHKAAALTGARDINFADSPRFSRWFRLRGEDEPAIRCAFTRRVREFFEERAGVAAQGFANELVYFRPPGWFSYAGMTPRGAERLYMEILELIAALRPQEES